MGLKFVTVEGKWIFRDRGQEKCIRVPLTSLVLGEGPSRTNIWISKIPILEF